METLYFTWKLEFEKWVISVGVNMLGREANDWMVDSSHIIDNCNHQATKFRIYSLGRSGPVKIIKEATMQNVLERI